MRFCARGDVPAGDGWTESVWIGDVGIRETRMKVNSMAALLNRKPGRLRLLSAWEAGWPPSNFRLQNPCK